LGIYQSEVGWHFGVSKDCITNWENGRNVPQIRHYPKIISFLGYNPFKNGEKTLGEKIFAFRCANGMSAKKFAKLIGVGEYAVLALEANRGVPRNGTLTKVNQIIEPN